MSIISPTILANSKTDFNDKFHKINFANRIQIDVMDGVFTDTKSIELSQVPIINNKQVDLHIMYQQPSNFLDDFLRLKPNMVIVHAESNCDVPKLASNLREHNIKTGLAILQNTTIAKVCYLFPHIQHLLIFSGHLGHYGGRADLSLLSKIEQAQQKFKYLEYGWDGGANLDNIIDLQRGGVDVINVGGVLQSSKNPIATFQEMTSLLG